MCEQLTVWTDTVPSEPGWYWLLRKANFIDVNDADGIRAAFKKSNGWWMFNGSSISSEDLSLMFKFGQRIPSAESLATQAAEMAGVRIAAALRIKHLEAELANLRKSTLTAELSTEIRTTLEAAKKSIPAITTTPPMESNGYEPVQNPLNQDIHSKIDAVLSKLPPAQATI